MLEHWRELTGRDNLHEDLTAKNKNKETMFKIACKNGHMDIIKFLVAFQFDSQLPEPWLRTDILANIYESFPQTLVPIMDKQVKESFRKFEGKADTFVLDFR